jgi:ubiquinone/menaquinone biosynthesis C-methylase UbiE
MTGTYEVSGGPAEEPVMPTEQLPPRTLTRDAWNALAAGYDEFATETNSRLAADVLVRLGIGPGTRLLDVAAGTGALGIPAARLGAQVLAIDIAPAMVERLAARAREEGLHGLQAQVMDGHDLALDDATFDVAASQFGVMLFDDLPRGLAELARVTVPGGQVVLIAFGAPRRVEFLGFVLAAIRAVTPDFTGLPLKPPPLPFQVADPEVLRRRFEGVRLRDIRIESEVHRMQVSSGRHLFDWCTNSNPIGAGLVADLTEQQRTEVQQVLDGMLRERAGDGGPAVLTAPVNVAIGTR